MTTDFQQARLSLGARLRELRTEEGLTGRELAARLGWPQSKVSKLETGKQTATADDLRAWAEGTGRPGTAEELTARLRSLESRSRSWHRQLAAGHRPVQDALTAEYERSSVFHAWEGAMVVGMLQTAEYARYVFSRYADLHGSVRDVEEAVRARIKRQELLYVPGKSYRILMWEAALRSLVCPPSVLAAQLDRLNGVLGLDTVSLGIIPFEASLAIPPANGFWVYDERLVIAEDWHAELWLDDAQSVGVHLRVWQALSDAAAYGADAHRVITRARRALGVP
ncbi:helix-turn-helix domain-containing protein [Streptomyces morookaense]|uniref:Helix-turn-helix transcriptional regulator n=1 Tax=Streptomyces morookaense TaxID=1970 RepID=A0A7Y7B4Z8_STRMO|nr:helix-turn-helix transcriptional regulator [Streptomyces morookaense]NVK79077.1 helix-turn-helix transcriptional regulator [Streptomyces morookaense]GHF10174.1 transcriptional regulator [Streptomyces morookaense]